MASAELDAINDDTILLIAARTTEDLLPEEQDPASTPTTEDEARIVVAQLIEQFGDHGPVDPALVLANREASAAAGRRILELMLDDPEVAPSVQALIDNPPEDEQMTVELAIGTAIVLGLLVKWLQTKFSLHIRRHDGKTDVDFSISADATPTDVIKDVTKSVVSAIGL